MHDWPAIHKRWEASPLNLKKFCEQEGLPYKYTSKALSLIDKENEEADKALAKRIILSSSPRAARGLVRLLESDDEKIQLQASTGVLDRSGFSVQALNLQVTNQAITQVLIAPIFAGQGEKVVDSFLGASVADTESDS